VPLDEVCNGIDDDCDGQTDEELGALSCGVGACATTAPACVSGQVGTCEPLSPAASESCDGAIDDDCDGVVDDGCACVNGAHRACYSGAPSTLGVGVCVAGEQECSAGAWGPCVGEVLQTDEACNSLDDDCDGEVDEGLGNVSCGIGACHQTMPACVNGEAVTCVPLEPGATEQCDGIVDDDCDGSVDEGCSCSNGETKPCYSGPADTLGKGTCTAGTQTCIGGVWDGVCVGEVTPVAETCDGTDEDCSGAVDDGFGTISCGKGACGVQVPECKDGQLQVCIPGDPSPEICNGVDDDCSGFVDDDGAVSSCVVPNGVPACVSGKCAVGSCAAGFGDCDDDATTGCEADLRTSASACGACGVACADGQACYEGHCATTCAFAPLSFPVPGCANVAANAAATADSSWGGNAPSHANDGNTCTLWNAGHHPVAWWSVDLGAATPIRGMTLVPNMNPSPADVVHVVELSLNGTDWTTQLTLSQSMAAQQVYPFDFGAPVTARYVRVTTTSSPSWVAWAEVGVYTCP